MASRDAVKKIYQVLELGGTTGLVVGGDTTTVGFHAASAQGRTYTLGKGRRFLWAP